MGVGCTFTNLQNGFVFLRESAAVIKVFVETLCQIPSVKFEASEPVQFFFFQYHLHFTDHVLPEKINSLHFCKFLTQYEVDICIEETLWQMKLFYYKVNSVALSFSKHGFWSINYILATVSSTGTNMYHH